MLHVIDNLLHLHDNYIKQFNSDGKITQKSSVFVIVHPYLTKVDSRHDSTNHASMFLDEPSGKAERVFAAPGIRIV